VGSLTKRIAMADRTLLLSYVLLVLFQIVHTLEEIACDVFEITSLPVKLTRNRYLIAASILSTITITPLALLLYDLPLGYYLGLVTSGVVGALQGVVHTVGFIRTRTVRASLGAGFYSAIPLAITGLIVFVQLLQHLLQ
jgi:hypothetical protein